jgi:hypothetical protein
MLPVADLYSLLAMGALTPGWESSLSLDLVFKV